MARGLLAVATLPIRFNGKVWGTLTIYDAEADVFQDKEVALLEEVAAAISLALDNLDRASQRRRAEEALAAAAREWSVSFDAMADAVSLHDPDHTITNVNQSLCDMLGKSKEELIGKKCYQVFHCTNTPIAGCPHEKSRATLRKEYAEVFEATLNEWLAVSASPVFDDAGCVLRFIHVVRRHYRSEAGRRGIAGEREEPGLGPANCPRRPLGPRHRRRQEPLVGRNLPDLWT